MKIVISLLIASLPVPVLLAQTITFHSDNMQANVSIDPKTMQPSNSRSFLMLAEEGEQAVSHQLEGIKAKDDSMKNVEQKLTGKAGGANAGADMAQLQARLNNDAATKANLENELAVIVQTKKEALKMVDEERKNYVHVVERAKAAAAAARSSQYQPTTHHDFYSPAYEQLKHINSTGNW